MRIYTFAATDEDSPFGAVALIHNGQHNYKGKMIADWCPVRITGTDPRDAREKAQAWYDAELERYALKAQVAKDTASRMDAARQAKARHSGAPINRAHAGMEPAPEVEPLTLVEDDDLVL